MKRVLAFSAYYVPEIAASLYLSENLYEDFARSGMEVELYVPIPTRGIDDKVRNKYKKKKLEKKINGRLKIHRVWLMREKRNVFLRALRYLLMNAVFIYKGIFAKADVIFVQSTPPTQGAMAAIIKKIKKIPFVYNLQDVFPDSLVGTGIAKKESLIYKIGEVIERFTYRNADKIIVISNDIKKNIMEKGVSESKIEVVPNWIDLKTIKPIAKKDNYLFDKYSIEKEKFNIVYAGNLGYAQNIEIILRAAKKLLEYEDIRFIIFGQGVQENEYKKMSKDLKLSNVSFFPLQPPSEISYVYSLGDVSVVSCKKGFGGSAMPSKTWSIMATETPVLASFDENTDMEKMIREEETGLFSRADNVEQLTENILQIFENRYLCERYGKNGRLYLEKNISRKVCTKKYIKVINSLYGKRK